MSTKDLIDRLTRTPAISRNRRPQGGDQASASGGGSEKSETRTRVNKRVIRRRRGGQSDDRTPTLSSAKPSSSGKNRRTEGKSPRREGSGRRRLSGLKKTRRPQGSEGAAAVGKKTAADSEAGRYEHLGLGSAVIGLPDDFKPPSAEPEVVEAAPAQEDAPAENAAAEGKAAEDAAAAGAAAAGAPAAGAAAAGAAAEGAAAAGAAEGAATAGAATAGAAAEAAPAEGAPKKEATAAGKAEAVAGEKPGADKKPKDKRGRFRHLGLGSAVIGLPEGFDPTNPRASAERAAALKARTAAAASTTTRTPSWRDKAAAAASPSPADARRRRAARTRPAGRGRRGGGRFMVGTEDLPYIKKSRKRRKGAPKKASPQAKAIKRRVIIESDSITVADLAHGMNVKSSQVIKSLIKLGQVARANDVIDLDTARLVSEDFEYEIVDGRFLEDDHLIELEESEENLQPRNPVVTIMGHVDHGKTTLLDSIRKANVADGEAGGITQHISAYQVSQKGHLITFIDTPGHEAFTQMRLRGAQVTDIVVLVVAADDGVMPQTVEALNHAKAAGVQIIVAVNKCDKVDAVPDRVRQELMAYDLVPEEYGGDTIFINVSALKGEGIDDLLESILLVSEISEFKANPDRHAEGSVLEARLERGRGAVATLLVQKGTLKQGDSVVLGTVWGRVRAMSDFRGKRTKSVGPSTPVEIIGLQDVPNAGDHFVVVESDKDARALAENRMEIERKRLEAEQSAPLTLERILQMRGSADTLSLNLIIKSDVGGTLEAMKASLQKINVDGTEIKVLHAGIGGVTEGDITLARTYDGIIIGFNVRPDAKARRAMSEYGIEVRTYRVIYEALEDVEKALKGMLAPVLKEVWQGEAELRATFSVPKVGTVAGCMVTDGKISRNHQIRLLRDRVVIWEGKLASLRRFKDDVREVAKGFECGMNLDGFNDIKVGDFIEAYTMEEVQRDL